MKKKTYKKKLIEYYSDGSSLKRNSTRYSTRTFILNDLYMYFRKKIT